MKSEKTIFSMMCGFQPHFCFLLTGAAEKLLVSENRLSSGFQGCEGGIGGSRAQSEISLEFSASGIPAKRAATLSTLSDLI